MVPAARKEDVFFCPNHGGGVIQGPCCQHVLIGGQPSARSGDAGACGSSGALDTIQQGNPLVLIAGEPAAGMSHGMAHGGYLVTGCGNVFIGNPPLDGNGNLLAVPPECAYLWKGMKSGMRPADLDRYRSPIAKFSAPRRGTTTFPGDATPAPTREYEVVIRGHKVKIIEPMNGAKPGTWLPSAAMVAKSLALLSDAQLARVHEVVICPTERPDAPATIADERGGTIRFFWRAVPHPQFDIDWVMIHEATHTLAEDAWTDPAVRAEWLAAMSADRRGVTSYGNKNEKEDFAEAVIMFALSKGTPCEATARAIFPARYAALEKLFPNGFGPHRKRH